MFSKDFYPTPKPVIEQMMGEIDITGKVFLEPSAGSGNIVDYLNSFGAKNVLTCETDPVLRRALQYKSQLIEEDFFQVKSEQVSHVHYIIMNPPFSKDVQHIIHAWEICPEGAEIVALCNASGITRQYYGHQKKLAEIAESNGTIQLLGKCFSTAQRPTEVEVALVHLYKGGTGENEFAGYFDTEEQHEKDGEGIMSYNEIREVVNRVIALVKEYDNAIDIGIKMNNLSGPISIGDLALTCTTKDGPIVRERFKKEIQKKAWAWVFSKMKMDKYLTRKLREDINKFVEEQTKIPFTMRNVYKMMEVIVFTHDNRMNELLVTAFDKICSYSAKNSTAGEKWKTNSNYKVNQRFILPYITDGTYPYLHTNYRYDEDIEDIIKALAYLTGADYDKLTGLRKWASGMPVDGNEGYPYKYIEREWGKWHTWDFFRVRGYKKGTMHFEFIDKKLWQTFNRKVGEIKGWELPQETDRKTRGTEHARNNKSTKVEVFTI